MNIGIIWNELNICFACARLPLCVYVFPVFSSFPTNDRFFRPLGFSMSMSMSMNTIRNSDYNWWWILQTNPIWDLIREIHMRWVIRAGGRSSSGILMHSTINAFFSSSIVSVIKKNPNEKNRTCSMHTHRKGRRERESVRMKLVSTMMISIETFQNDLDLFFI